MICIVNQYGRFGSKIWVITASPRKKHNRSFETKITKNSMMMFKIPFHQKWSHHNLANLANLA
jgi:hypothetical protein